MRDSVLLLSDNQDFANTTSTGEVTDNVYDVETSNGSLAVLTDDQIVGFMNVTLITVPAQATIVGTEGLVIEARTAAAAALTSLYEVIGGISILPAKIVAGAKFSVPCRFDVLQKYVGGWVRAVNTAVVGTIYADIEFSDLPISENESLQKVVS